MRTLLTTILSTGLVFAGLGTASASAPAGVWSIPQLVQILEETADRPMVVLEGLFAVYTGDGDGPDGTPALGGYTDARWGVMYYQCKAGEKEMCLLQWNELKTAAASEAPCRGWGNQEDPAGTVRDYGSPTNPDDFPINGGVNTGFTPCEYLATVPEPVAEPGPEAAEPAAEAPVVTEDTPVEQGAEPSPEPAVESSAATDTRVSPMPTVDEGGGCVGGGAEGLLGLAVLALWRRRPDGNPRSVETHEPNTQGLP